MKRKWIKVCGHRERQKGNYWVLLNNIRRMKNIIMEINSVNKRKCAHRDYLENKVMGRALRKCLQIMGKIPYN